MAARSVIFYSWQSDIPNRINRTFIENALEKAVRAIRNDTTIDVEPVVDRDVEGMPGAPDISRAIFEKIARSQVFVCDVTIINQGAQGRLTPNPNVLVELGYALKALGEHRVLLIQNRAFGQPESLPFDLRGRHSVSYKVSDETDAEARAEQKKSLERDLTRALRTILGSQEKESSIAIPFNASPYIKSFVPLLDSPSRAERKSAVLALKQSHDPVSKDILLSALHHPARDVRINAALALISDNQSWPQLIPILLDVRSGSTASDMDEGYRHVIAELGKIASRAIPEFLAALRNEETHVRYNVLLTLKNVEELGANIAPYIIPSLHDNFDKIRLFAADILGKIRAVDAIPELSGLLVDRNSEVRRSAISAIGSIGSEDAIQSLIDALSDSDVSVQSAAALALKRYGDRAAPKLIFALDGDDTILRYRSIEILGQIKCEDAIPKVISAIKDHDAGVRSAAIGMLGQMRIPNLTEDLVNALADPEAQVRGAAAYSLGLCGSADAVPALMKALNDTFITVRMHAAQSLGSLKDERAVLSLRTTLRDEIMEVRVRATWALGAIGGSSAISALKEALYDKENIVYNTAVESLRMIGTEEALEALRMHRINQ